MMCRKDKRRQSDSSLHSSLALETLAVQLAAQLTTQLRGKYVFFLFRSSLRRRLHSCLCRKKSGALSRECSTTTTNGAKTEGDGRCRAGVEKMGSRNGEEE